jgi:hypothetical protein
MNFVVLARVKQPHSPKRLLANNIREGFTNL